ncbi:WYL domain-containing protein [Ruminococcus flavefaciens]|uniref:WYL domain-containing protein n=1 Tax=Ruminococcus flavefaciens TaxID=1265 RepID=A0A1K1MH07_RUMFL|nr:WYL domain-containing protein [Ruminococcus flavefaciens]SFW22432.1 WYL domain-containing protein [Ruminococcus flavefaciens]
MNIFSEIYGTYFRIAAKLMENEATDEKTVRDTVMRDGFRDSVLFLPQKLIPGGEDWGLFRREKDNTLRRITKKAPAKVLTKLQKMWLKAKLSDPRIRLFMDDETIEQLQRLLVDVKPLYRHEHFRLTDRFADHDDYSDEKYISNFRTALDAVKNRRIVDIHFQTGRGKRASGRFVLLKIEFSPKNGKFRAYCYLLRNDKIRSSGLINIGRIESITDTGRVFRTPVSMEDYFSSRKCKEPAVIRVTNERNGVERFMLEFASFEKHTVRDLEKNEYTVELWYDEQDETEVLIMLLSFGPVIEILGPEKLRSQARERLERQYELLYGKIV